jgi:hypothetical protein
MKIPATEPDYSGLPTFQERRASFLRKLQTLSHDLPTLWLILDAIRRANPTAFDVFIEHGGTNHDRMRKAFALQIKPQLDAECYASFLYNLGLHLAANDASMRDRLCGNALIVRTDILGKKEIVSGPSLIALRSARVLELHARRKEFAPKGFVAAWLRGHATRRKFAGQKALTWRDFRKLERLFDATDTKKGAAFRATVTLLLTGYPKKARDKIKPTPFLDEELRHFVAAVGTPEDQTEGATPADFDVLLR